MNFEQTGLPDRPMFRASFDAGWEKHTMLGYGEAGYARGPVALAKLVLERGGDCRQVVVAACLAGPAAFSSRPDARLDKKVVAFAREIMDAECADTVTLPHMMTGLSADARLFLQASAILLLDNARGDSTEMQKTWQEALNLYSAARGGFDTYSLDTRFEIAAMKITTLLEDRSHLWVRFTTPAETVRA